MPGRTGCLQCGRAASATGSQRGFRLPGDAAVPEDRRWRAPRDAGELRWPAGPRDAVGAAAGARGVAGERRPWTAAGPGRVTARRDDWRPDGTGPRGHRPAGTGIGAGAGAGGGDPRPAEQRREPERGVGAGGPAGPGPATGRAAGEGGEASGAERVRDAVGRGVGRGGVGAGSEQRPAGSGVRNRRRGNSRLGRGHWAAGGRCRRVRRPAHRRGRARNSGPAAHVPAGTAAMSTETTPSREGTGRSSASAQSAAAALCTWRRPSVLENVQASSACAAVRTSVSHATPATPARSTRRTQGRRARPRARTLLLDPCAHPSSRKTGRLPTG